MKLTNEEIINEKSYLEKVKVIIKDKINEINNYVIKEKEKILEKKRDIYENSKGFSEPDQELIEDVYNSEFKIDLINKKIDKLYLYEKSLNNPYFGKVIYEEDNEENEIYIGICSVEENYNFFVYDWRSQIASLFYNYEVGNANYKTDSENINVNIKRKIQFKINNGELIRAFDSSVNIDDDYLQDILANSSNERLTNIVSTIQKEQNEIIRNNEERNIIVQGVAGSGKTVVALHRIAYLLYKDINLTSNDILIFSPNDIFTNYISDVLPSLGEENTLGDTFTNYFSKFLKPYELEDYSSFIKRTNTNKVSEDSYFKLNDKRELTKFLDEYTKNFNFKKKFTINENTFYSKDINYMFNEKYNKVNINERFNKITEYVCGKIRKEDKKTKFRIKEYIKNSCNITTDIYEIYNLFLKEYNIKNEYIKNNTIMYEDITNLIYIYFYINGYYHNTFIKQIVIDEVQDYTLFQLEIIKKIFNKAYFTVLGDINQLLNKYYKLDSLEKISKLFKNYKYIELNKTYRSSEEIVEYSNKILGLNNVCAIRNTVNEVEIYDINRKIDNIINELKEKYKKIAIITDNDINANKIYQKLNRKDLELITVNSDNISKDIIIIPSFLSKGLEFDAVVIYNDSNIFIENKNLYYVSCTRAHHKLIIINEPQY